MGLVETEIKKKLKKHLKGVPGPNLESLARLLGVLPYERVLLATDIGISIATTNLRAAIEMLKAAPETSRLLDVGDVRVWGEIGKRLAANSVDAATAFFQVSPATLALIPDEMRSPVLRLINKQSALSANTALESFRSAPSTLSAIGDHETAAQVLTICLELARHSVKHSNDLLGTAPGVIAQIRAADSESGSEIASRALTLTATFAFRSGGTAAEFFGELGQIAGLPRGGALDALFANTETYLERSGGVAIQYFKAASRVFALAGETAFDRWTALAQRVALQGNAASYHFMKASPQIVGDLAAIAQQRRAQVIASVLEVVDELADRNTLAAVECFKASPLALRAASLGQFKEWARKGLDNPTDGSRRIQAYYALESKASQEALFKIEGGLTLDSVAHTLRLYVEGLTGRALNVAPISSIPEEAKIGDGKTIYLPSVVAEFEDEEDNFRLFKVIAAHASAQIEFETYSRNSPELIAALGEINSAFAGAEVGDGGTSTPRPTHRLKKKRKSKKDEGEGPGFLEVISEFPNPDLAMRIFTTVENGRVDFLLRRVYRGIRRDLDFVRGRLRDRRPAPGDLSRNIAPFELLFQIAICGGVAAEWRNAYPVLVREFEGILAAYVFRDDAGVGSSLMASRRIYDMFVERPDEADTQSEQDSDSNRDEDDDARSRASADQENQQVDADSQTSMVDTSLSYWAHGQPQEIVPDAEMFGQISAGESTEQDLEKGDRAFYYDEWDRELGDYRTRWCRIIERGGARGSRGFVEMVRTRYAGIISSVRYQFQLLRPENLQRIRGEIDGEDYDLQAVIDYALDKRSTGLVDDRLYTRKLRRQRDVAVSFLLDMSSSTARTISRYPNHPYTQPGQRIIDIEKEGLVLMSEALEAVGDSYSMQGFTSEGRRNVKFYVIKDFSESYSSEVERRIGGITYQNNTRLGAAIRHAASRLKLEEARTKLLIVLSDGRPYDHDYGDSRYAREDTRMALRHTRTNGITPFCITIDRESEDQLKDMYGEVGYTIIDDVLSLPERLPGIYTRLTT